MAGERVRTEEPTWGDDEGRGLIRLRPSQLYRSVLPDGSIPLLEGFRLELSLAVLDPIMIFHLFMMPLIVTSPCDIIFARTIC